jgi:hypothetical protein
MLSQYSVKVNLSYFKNSKLGEEMVSELSNEISNRISGENSLTSALSSEIDNRISSEESLQLKMNTMLNDVNANSTTPKLLNELNTTLGSQVNDIVLKNTSLSQSLISEIDSRVLGNTSLSSSLSVETSNRISSDISLKEYINLKISNILGGSPDLLDSLGELARAIGSDEKFSVTMMNYINTKTSSEVSERVSGDSSIASALSVETSNRVLADTSLSESINGIGNIVTGTLSSSSIIGNENNKLTCGSITLSKGTYVLNLNCCISNNTNTAETFSKFKYSLITSSEVVSSFFDESVNTLPSGGKKTYESCVILQPSSNTTYYMTCDVSGNNVYFDPSNSTLKSVRII